MIKCCTSFIANTYPPNSGRDFRNFYRNILRSVRNLSTLGTEKSSHQPSTAQSDTSHDPKTDPTPPPTPTPPPQYLYQTASPQVYVAACAMDELQIDPKSLFTEYSSLNKNTRMATLNPPSFRSSHFEYISPKIFGHQLPTYDQQGTNTPIPEIAILGKSNVGKSSLINSLTRKRDLAKISKTPGRTQQINYFGFIPKDSTPDGSIVPSSSSKNVAGSFSLSNVIAFLIDLPGYGYAEAPVDRVVKWQDTTQDFLQHRRDTGVLKRLYILVDSRHGLSSLDRAVIGWLDDADIPYCIVLTKADRIGRPMLVRYANEICMRYHSQMYNNGYVSESMDSFDNDIRHVHASHGLQSPLVHVTSSKTGEGIHELMWTMHWDLFDPQSFDSSINRENNQ